MSLNQINANIVPGPIKKVWLNERVNNVNILNDLNVNMDNANVGDELILDVGLNATWAPSAIVDANPTLAAVLPFTEGVIGVQNGLLPLTFLNPPPKIDAAYQLVEANKNIRFTQIGMYIMYLNFNCIPSVNSVDFSTEIERRNGDNYVPYYGALGRSVSDTAASTVAPAVFFREQTLNAFCPILITDLSIPENNEFRVVVYFDGPVGATVTNINTDSSVCIIKV